MKKYFLQIIIAFTLLAPLGTSAQTSDATRAELLASLLAQVEALQAELNELKENEVVTAADKDYEFIEIDFYEGPYRAMYQVVNGDEIHLGDGRHSSVHDKIWEVFQIVAGEKFINDFVQEFRVYRDDDVSHAGFVHTLDERGEEWMLAVNLADIDFGSRGEEMIVYELLVHEYSHILFEDETDIRDDFFVEFWTDDDAEHAEGAADEDDRDDYWDLLDEYYDDNDDRFVSAYATTNEYEDLAESFTYFVLEDTPRNDRDEVDEKLLYFYEFDEFIDTRERVREAFDI